MATRRGYHVPSNLVKDEKENVIAEPASGDVQEAIRERRHGAVHSVHVAGAAVKHGINVVQLGHTAVTAQLGRRQKVRACARQKVK